MPSRFLIGIDLGTTNSVVAYIDTHPDDPQPSDAASAIRVFDVPQLIAHGEVRTLSALPSFLYFPTAEELSSGAVSATWDEDPPMVTGLLAREQGALVPARQVSSAKSWLSHPGVNRRAKILPAQAEPPQPMISPVEASARYLMHLRDAWNGKLGTTPDTRFEQQEIVLTVPASFDEEARELTVEAARIAGLGHLTLLEEPLAAFYAWMISGGPYLPAVGKCGKEEDGGQSNPDVASRGAVEAGGPHKPSGGPFKPSVGLSGAVESLRDGELILICDIGGGTTDFSLVRATLVDGELQFERTAIGDHILLGGDNLDLALARLVEEKLDTKLTLRQRYALRRSCCAVKEKLLNDASLPHLPVTILGSGRAVIGQALSVDLTREEVLQILTTGFLPITPPDAMPSRARPTGLRELGLPYAADAAITRHLAAFLTQAAIAMNTGQPMVRPDAVLFNGGFCTPSFTRERIAEAISNWFSEAPGQWRPKLLENPSVESAVARGAAIYGRVRRGTGSRVKVGSARAYYIGLPGADADSAPQGICVLPAGSQAGTTLPPLAREFTVLANRPISFTLYSSRTRHDAHGDLATLDETDFHLHAPLTSLLRYGKKMRELYLKVRLRAGFTEVGTLELWCESPETGHRWRLQFELRGEDPEAQPSAPQASAHGAGTNSHAATSDAFDSAAQLIRTVFAGSAEPDAPAPETLVGQLEATLGAKRDQWPIAVIRGLADVLLESASGRKHSPRHELRWLNLLGFCLRPGFGFPGDDARIHQLWAVVPAAGVFADDLQCQVEMLAMLRRISGGINASRQQALYRGHTSAADNKKKRPRRNRQLEYEVWRLLASLEHLPARHRASLGRELLTKIKSEPEDAIWLWSLSRLGARIPLYGPLHCVVTPEIAAEWLKVLLVLPTCTAATASAIAAIAQRTDDSSRDIDETIRAQAISRLTEFGLAPEAIAAVSHYVPPQRADAVRSFGESLPHGLPLVSSANCLLSLPALHG